MGYLTLITGCMFAQKTTELVRHIRRYRSIGYSVFVVNSHHDTRYGSGEIVTHDVEREEATVACCLADLDTVVRSGIYQVVAIDEAQFFPDLFEYVSRWADECSIHLVIAGLDGTFTRDPFGDLLRLIPHAEEVIRLSALCSRCRNGTKAIYSRKRSNAMENPDAVAIPLDQAEEIVIAVGGADQYEPVCRKHYLEK